MAVNRNIFVETFRSDLVVWPVENLGCSTPGLSPLSASNELQTLVLYLLFGLVM